MVKFTNELLKSLPGDHLTPACDGAVMVPSGADIAKEIRARVADLNELVETAARLGLDTRYETNELSSGLVDYSATQLTAHVSQRL